MLLAKETAPPPLKKKKIKAILIQILSRIDRKVVDLHRNLQLDNVLNFAQPQRQLTATCVHFAYPRRDAARR